MNTDQRHGKPGLWRWAVVLVPGLAVALLPIPAFNPQQQHLLGVFLATIIALIVQPVPMGVAVIVAMTLLVLTRTLTPEAALSGFAEKTVWLIVSAFLFAQSVRVSGLGRRLAYAFIRSFGRSPLTLAYSVAASDVVLAPFVPSDTARGGGVIFPIARSLSQAFNSEPGETARRMGSYLMLVAFHATYTASGMFLTGMIANPVIADFAKKIAHVDLSWGTWFLGAIVPGLITLTIMPWLLLKLHTPEITDTEPAREFARQELQQMGPLSRNEKLLVAVLLAVMTGWVTSPWHGIHNTFIALAGLSALLLLRVLAWDELLAEKKAWDALIWFAPLVMMSDQLNKTGTIKIVSAAVFSHIQGWPWWLAFVALMLAYFYAHYSFASMTAHITALYPAFLAAALAAGIHPMLGAMCLAYLSNLYAGLTHYGTGSAPIYFGAGYVSQAEWWKLGFIIGLVNLFIWLGVAPLWWRVLGLW